MRSPGVTIIEHLAKDARNARVCESRQTLRASLIKTETKTRYIREMISMKIEERCK